MEINVSSSDRLKLLAILRDYSTLPEYCGFEDVNVNTKSLFGDFPINVAATRGNIEEISILLKFGANIHAKGEHGYTPLHNAVEQGHLDAVKFLLVHGANKNELNDNGDSAISLSVLLEEDTIMSFLRNQ